MAFIVATATIPPTKPRFQIYPVFPTTDNRLLIIDRLHNREIVIQCKDANEQAEMFSWSEDKLSNWLSQEYLIHSAGMPPKA